MSGRSTIAQVKRYLKRQLFLASLDLNSVHKRMEPHSHLIATLTNGVYSIWYQVGLVFTT